MSPGLDPSLLLRCDSVVTKVHTSRLHFLDSNPDSGWVIMVLGIISSLGYRPTFEMGAMRMLTVMVWGL